MCQGFFVLFVTLSHESSFCCKLNQLQKKENKKGNIFCDSPFGKHKTNHTQKERKFETGRRLKPGFNLSLHWKIRKKPVNSSLGVLIQNWQVLFFPEGLYLHQISQRECNILCNIKIENIRVSRNGNRVKVFNIDKAGAIDSCLVISFKFRTTFVAQKEDV